MRILKYITILLIIAFTTVSLKSNNSTKYKCMIQMKNYTGEGAYIVISLIDPEGNYEKTLYVHGDDEEWYHDITQWWKNLFGKKRPNLDAITGATLSGGKRAITILEIEKEKLDKGYKLRFETAVEDQEYYVDDVEFELTSASVKSKKEGKGFIRYIRMMPQ